MKRTICLALILASSASAYACSSATSAKPPAAAPDAGDDPGVIDDTPGEVPEETGDAAPAPDASGPPINPIEGATVKEDLPGSGFGFLDGPQWRGSALYFSHTFSKNVVKFTPPTTTESVATTYLPLGTTMDGKTGTMVTAESESAATPHSVLVRTADTGVRSTMTLNFGAVAPWESPNDIAVRTSDGTMYVTDPGYQKEEKGGAIANHLYRVTPAGTVVEAASYADNNRPNGIALSPDQKTLYVGFTDGIAGAPPQVLKYTVNADGSLGAAAKFIDVPPANSQPDGIGVDDAGNVYVAVRAGVEVYAPGGTKWGTIATTKQATNVAFGGADRKTIYITADGALYEATGKIPGILQ